MAGYSGTPLAKKLGIKTAMQVRIEGAPQAYRAWIESLPDDVRLMARVTNATDLVHLFVTRASALVTRLEALRGAIRPDAVVWVSWPKRTSGVASDVTEDVIRRVALPLGFVDVKVCAVDDRWSALKLVVRKSLR